MLIPGKEETYKIRDGMVNIPGLKTVPNSTSVVVSKSFPKAFLSALLDFHVLRSTSQEADSSVS